MNMRKLLIVVAATPAFVTGTQNLKTLEKYIYATGTGRAVSQGASRLGQVVMYAGMKL